jgi:hypothetical protein
MATWDTLDEETKKLFEDTAGPGAGQGLWEWQNAGSPTPEPTAPVAPTPTNDWPTALYPTGGGPSAPPVYTPAQPPVVTQSPLITNTPNQAPSAPTQPGQQNFWESDYWKQQQDQARLDAQQLAEFNRQAMLFTQGIQQGQLDIAKAAQSAQEAYQKAMLEYNNAQLAQQAANAAMDANLRQQTIQIQRMTARAQLRRGSAFARARVTFA